MSTDITLEKVKKIIGLYGILQTTPVDSVIKVETDPCPDYNIERTYGEYGGIVVQMKYKGHVSILEENLRPEDLIAELSGIIGPIRDSEIKQNQLSEDKLEQLKSAKGLSNQLKVVVRHTIAGPEVKDQNSYIPIGQITSIEQLY